MKYYYPLQKKLVLVGFILGFLTSVILHSFLMGFSVLVILSIVGFLWRPDEMPVFIFPLSIQWIFIISGYVYFLLIGYYPGSSIIGDIEWAIFFSLLGLIFITLGIRIAFNIFEPGISNKVQHLKKYRKNIDVFKLFLVVFIVNILGWFILLTPSLIYFNAAQFIQNIIAIKYLLFLMLLIVILIQKEGYIYGLISIFVTLIPTFISKQSEFTIVFFILIISLSIAWKPWIQTINQRRRNIRIIIFLILISIFLFYLAILWEGAVKPNWRNAEVTGTPIERIRIFYDLTFDPIKDIDHESGTEMLVSRISSVEQFSLVLERVPKVIPHENGSLFKNTINHIIKPRIIFPNKPVLAKDSWMAEEYAGLKIHPNASVGIGYMAELYVDFGIYLMFLVLLIFGILLGLSYIAIIKISSTYYSLLSVSIVPYLLNYLSYEGNLTKIIGGMLLSLFTLLIYLKYIAPILEKRIIKVNIIKKKYRNSYY